MHFQYTGWPDFDAPTNTESIIALVGELRKKVTYLRKKECKVLVHCSAGVGRTGTFIALYQIMEQLKEIGLYKDRGILGISAGDWEAYYYSQTIDIFNTVLKLRSKRVHMVSKINIK